MALQHIDFNDYLPPLASRGISIPKEFTIVGNTINIPGRYLDPVSSRLSELSQDAYYRRPVSTYLYGKGDFIYHGQKPGTFQTVIPDIFGQSNKNSIEPPMAGGRWKEYKIWDPITLPKETSYTNLPAKY